LVLALGRITTGLMTQGKPPERLRAALGAIVLLACFTAGVSYSYRWIFVVWPAIWLWRQATAISLSGRQRWVARGGCALVLLCLWLDGGLCLTVNLFLPPGNQAWLDHLQFVWRLWTQPLHWLLMMMFAGWLLEAGLVTVREWWSARHEFCAQ
jgi:hypothetical protein